MMKKTLFILCFAALVSAKAQNVNSAADKFRAAISTIHYAYVDTVNPDKLVEQALISMLENLDPHSVYIPKEEVQKMNEPLEGNFEGVGIQFQLMKDTILVVAAIPGGPSEKLGIMAGDKIIKIDDETVAGVKINNDGVMKRLRGKKGSIVNVDIKRGNKSDLLRFRIERDKIPIYSLDAAYMAAPKTGYIKLNRFARNTMDEFNEAFDKLKSQGMENLILDLKGNGGGFLNMAIELADQFLNDKKLIVYTEGVRQAKQESFATDKGKFETGKLIILIDEGSASASEIVSGAVQDWDRGLIIGRRSFGKGLVQRPFNLPDGAMMRLTTARYYTPTGRSIQKPYADGVQKYHEDLSARIKHGELISADSIKFPDSLRYFTPNNRAVYGGGGIMPDLFVAIDTTFATNYYGKITRNGLQNKFALEYLESRRAEYLKQYPTSSDFVNKFQIDQQIINDFIAFAEKEGVTKNETEFQKSEKTITTQLKALLARNLYDMNVYFQIMNSINESYVEALKVMSDNTFDKYKIAYKEKKRK
jgi:carboxyl-terminal processing protease